VISLRRFIPTAWLVTGLACLFPATSQANLVFGGLSWAPIDQTVNWSYNDILQEFESGGLYEGYRHATLQETWNLVESLGFNGGATPEENSTAVIQIQQDLGYTLTSSAGQFSVWSLGFTADGTRFDIRLVQPDPGDPQTFQGYAYETDYPFYDSADPEIGHYLVVPVPEPAGLPVASGLFSCAVIFLFRRRARA